MITIPMHVSVSGASIPMTVNDGGHQYSVGIGSEYSLVRNEYYDGSYSFTPSDEEQIIQSRNLVMRQNITIAPIPNNYGRVSYNGSVITIE